MALMPEISGNEINGLGEAELRNPSYVYWGNNPDDIAHGELQKWFYSVDPGLPEFANIRSERARILTEPLQALASKRQQPSDTLVQAFFTEQIDNGIFDQVGVAPFDPIWAYEGVELDFKNIIVLGYQHDY